MKLPEHFYYNSDLTPCEFTMFPYMIVKMKGREFPFNNELLNSWYNKFAVIIPTEVCRFGLRTCFGENERNYF